jgi:hypothetical protein
VAAIAATLAGWAGLAGQEHTTTSTSIEAPAPADTLRSVTLPDTGQPALRDVTAPPPPMPVTVTRSSR